MEKEKGLIENSYTKKAIKIQDELRKKSGEWNC